MQVLMVNIMEEMKLGNIYNDLRGINLKAILTEIAIERIPDVSIELKEVPVEIKKEN